MNFSVDFHSIRFGFFPSIFSDAFSKPIKYNNQLYIFGSVVKILRARAYLSTPIIHNAFVYTFYSYVYRMNDEFDFKMRQNTKNFEGFAFFLVFAVVIEKLLFSLFCQLQPQCVNVNFKSFES